MPQCRVSSPEVVEALDVLEDCSHASRCGSLSSTESWGGILGIVRHRTDNEVLSRLRLPVSLSALSSDGPAGDTARSSGSQRAVE
jgi:hypothetical protein